MAASNPVYKGFTTANYEESGGSFAITDVACIAQDITNNIQTALGQRVRMPDYGTRIPTLIFEPSDSYTKDVMIEDITTVINNDPRVKLIVMDFFDNVPNTLTVGVKLSFIKFGVTQYIYIEVDS